MRCGHEELDQLMVNFFSFSASQHQTKFSCCFWKCDRNAGRALFYDCLSKTFSRFLHTYYLHLSSIPESHWRQLVTAICDEGDGLILFEGHSQGHGYPLSCHVSFGFTVTDTMVTFQIFIVELLCNLIDMWSASFCEKPTTQGPNIL
jgi:hypothetical protein